jgi:hypothetical protein
MTLKEAIDLDDIRAFLEEPDHNEAEDNLTQFESAQRESPLIKLVKLDAPEETSAVAS